MKIDHIFILAPGQGREADELVRLGFVEGSGRVHQGIGTQNRRFFFQNFYLEILWVHDRKEAENLNKWSLLKRFAYRETRYSPFGLCLENTPDTDRLFEEVASKWQPEFLPEGQKVEIITSENLPWIFKFPKHREKKSISEPRKHHLGLESLTKVTFLLKEIDLENVLNEIQQNTFIQFEKAERNMLLLEFDGGRLGESVTIPQLNLKITY